MLNSVLTPTPIYNVIERSNGLIWKICNVKLCANTDTYVQYYRNNEWFHVKGL